MMATDQLDRFRRAIDDDRTGTELEKLVQGAAQGAHRGDRARVAQDRAQGLSEGPSADRAAAAEGSRRVEAMAGRRVARHRAGEEARSSTSFTPRSRCATGSTRMSGRPPNPRTTDRPRWPRAPGGSRRNNAALASPAVTISRRRTAPPTFRPQSTISSPSTRRIRPRCSSGSRRGRRTRPWLRSSTSCTRRDPIVRMLGMRRTVHVVDVDLVPVVHASSTRAVAARERKRTLDFVERAGIPDAQRWLAKLEAQTLRALEEARRGDCDRVGERRAWTARTASRSARARSGRARSACRRACCRCSRPTGRSCAAGRAAAGSAASTGGRRCRRGCPDGHEGTVGRRRACATRRAAGCRPTAPRRSNDIKWWTGWTVGEVRDALAGLSVEEVDLDGVDRRRARGRRRAGQGAGAVRGAAARTRHLRHGLGRPKLVPRTAWPAAVRSVRQRRTDGLVGRPGGRWLGAAQGRRGRLPRARRRRGAMR